MQGRVKRCLLVVGASAEVWNYDNERGPKFDVNAEYVREYFRQRKLNVTSGCLELNGVKTVDKTGHVHPDSAQQIEKCYYKWIDDLTEDSNCILNIPLALRMPDEEYGIDDEDISCTPNHEAPSPDTNPPLDTSDQDDRPWGSAILKKGERDAIERALISQALSVEPNELAVSLQEDGWWQGLPWRMIAKALHVQRILFKQDGWNIKYEVLGRVIERAMQLERTATPIAISLEQVWSILIVDPVEFANALADVKRYNCLRCGSCPEPAYRKENTHGNCPAWNEVYCHQCFNTEDNIQEQDQTIFEGNDSYIKGVAQDGTSEYECQNQCEWDEAKTTLCVHRWNRRQKRMWNYCKVQDSQDSRTYPPMVCKRSECLGNIKLQPQCS